MTKKTISLASLLLASIVTTASADAPASPLAQLDPMVGTWKVAGSMTMGKDTVKVNASITCKKASAKTAILCTMDLKGIPGLATYSETDLFGYEPGSNTLHWFSVTNAGETHDHVAKAGEAKLQFVYTGTQEGKPFKEVIDMDLGKDGKSLSFKSEASVAGSTVAVFEGKGKK